MSIKYLNKTFFKENEQLCTFFCDAPRTKQPHTNEFWELCYIYEGEGILNINNATEPIKSEQFLLISPHTSCSLLSPPKKSGAIMRVCKCIFTQEYFDLIFKNYSKTADIENYHLYNLLNENKVFYLHLSDDRRKNIQNLLWLVAHEYSHYTSGSPEVIEYAMNALFICISRLYENQINNFIETPKNNVIEEIENYIKTNFGYKITLEDLADRFHLSREYISRYFKKCTGKTISQFLLETRIETAKGKLSTTLIPISDIAEYCGYSSISNFQKAFKRITGQTPSEYRKTHKIITKQ